MVFSCKRTNAILELSPYKHHKALHIVSIVKGARIDLNGRTKFLLLSWQKGKASWYGVFCTQRSMRKYLQTEAELNCALELWIEKLLSCFDYLHEIRAMDFVSF